jgi:hypothetical protein
MPIKWILCIIGLVLMFSGCHSNFLTQKPNVVEPNYVGDTPKTISTTLIYNSLARIWWIVPLGIGFMALGGVMTFYGQKIGIKLVSCGLLSVLIYFSLLRWMQLLLWLGLVAIVGILFYWFKTHARGLKETVYSVEKLLDKFPEKRKEMLEILKENQKSTQTKKLIKKIKKTFVVEVNKQNKTESEEKTDDSI